MGTALSVAFAVGLAIFMAIFFGAKYLSLRIVYLPLPGGGWYSAPSDVTAHDVQAHLDMAVQCLIERTHWTAAQFAVVCPRVRVLVRKEVQWKRLGDGLLIAGCQEGNTLVVGKDMAALCHELGHLMEQTIDMVVDEEHVTWLEKGIVAAQDAYYSWRMAQKK